MTPQFEANLSSVHIIWNLDGIRGHPPVQNFLQPILIHNVLPSGLQILGYYKLAPEFPRWPECLRPHSLGQNGAIEGYSDTLT